MSDTSIWQRLSTLIDDDELLWPRVQTAIDDDDDPWSALIDGLDDAGALASLELDDTGMELADALAQLPRIVRLQPDLGEVNDTDDLDEAIRLADEILQGAGYRLLLLDEPDGDAHALVVVPRPSADEIVGLAATLEHGASLPA